MAEGPCGASRPTDAPSPQTAAHPDQRVTGGHTRPSPRPVSAVNPPPAPSHVPASPCASSVAALSSCAVTCGGGEGLCGRGRDEPAAGRSCMSTARHLHAHARLHLAPSRPVHSITLDHSGLGGCTRDAPHGQQAGGRAHVEVGVALAVVSLGARRVGLLVAATKRGAGGVRWGGAVGGGRGCSKCVLGVGGCAEAEQAEFGRPLLLRCRPCRPLEPWPRPPRTRAPAGAAQAHTPTSPKPSSRSA